MTDAQIKIAAQSIFAMRKIPDETKEQNLQQRKIIRKKLELFKFNAALRQIMRDYQVAG